MDATKCKFSWFTRVVPFSHSQVRLLYLSPFLTVKSDYLDPFLVQSSQTTSIPFSYSQVRLLYLSPFLTVKSD